MGLERLVLLLGQQEHQPSAAAPDLYVISRGEQAQAAALPLARQCRLAGLAVELDASGAAFGKQLKRADRSGARWAAVIGDAEAAAGMVQLKDLRAGAQAAGQPEAEPGERQLSAAELVAELAQSVAAAR
jgi:histidyl-tRNA synthetase